MGLILTIDRTVFDSGWAVCDRAEALRSCVVKRLGEGAQGSSHVLPLCSAVSTPLRWSTLERQVQVWTGIHWCHMSLLIDVDIFRDRKTNPLGFEDVEPRHSLG